MFDLFDQSWFSSLTGLIGLIVGLTGIVLYLRSRIGARPACYLDSIRLLGDVKQNLPSEVEVLFKSKSVPRLTLTKIYLWNAGKETLKGDQIIEDDPLRCELNKSDIILKASVATQTRSVNKVSIKDANIDFGTVGILDRVNALKVNFDYLDPGDGARIDILHTSELLYPKIHGTFMSIPKGVIFPASRKFSLQNIADVFLAMVVGMGMFSLLIIFGSPVTTGSLIGFILIVIPIMALVYMYRSGERKLYPSVLDKEVDQ